jgi:WD40 repeat protein
LASVNYDGKACFWDLTTGKLLYQTEGVSRWAAAVVFDQAARPLAASALYDTPCLRLWNLASGEELLRDRGARGAISCLAFAPSGAILVSGSWDNTLRFWDPASGTQKACLDIPADPQPPHSFSPDTPIRLTFDGGGQTLVAVGRYGLCWEATAGGHGWTLRPMRGYPGPVLAVNGDRVVTGRFLKEEPVPAGPGPDAKRFISNDRVELCLWDRGSTRERYRIAPGPAGIVDLSFYQPEFHLGDDGILVGIELDRLPKLWDVARRRFLYEIRREEPDGNGGEFVTAALAPDARVLAVGWDKAIVLYEVASGQSFARWQVPGAAVAFSADGRRMAAGTAEGISIWDVRTSQRLLQLPGHGQHVGALAFSPDGKVLASGSGDTTVLLWDLAGLGGPATPGGKPLEPAELEKLWDELANPEVARARQAVLALAGVPAQAGPLLLARLRPVPRVPAERLSRLIGDLDSDAFTARQAARSELADLGELAKPALRKALEGRPTAEVRRSIAGLLEQTQCKAPLLRALEVLERIGTPGARQVLEALAEGAPEARLTQEARASRERLARRPAENP